MSRTTDRLLEPAASPAPFTAALLLDGELTPGSPDTGTFETIDPATEEILGTAADATPADMDRAIDAARRAFDDTTWPTDLALRVRCLRQLGEALRRHADELREGTIREVGAPRFLTYGAQLDSPVGDLGWFTDLAESYEWSRDLGRATPMGMPSHRHLVREPIGVVGAITPWNFPHQINLAKLGPALAAGNTVVLKPAPDTPWCAAVLGRIIAEETDIPAGVVNIVTSSAHALGAQLAEDPRVDMVSFTGSTATGRTVMATAAQTLKKVFLELGGKSAFVILDDVPSLRDACSYAAFAGITHAGQGCAITTRILVPRDRYDEAVQLTADTLRNLGVGDPQDDKTVCGPVISARQRSRIEGYLDLALAEGGSFACGGGRPAGRDRGFWIEPTLITGLTNAARAAREEIFGPVLVILPHDGDDDAVRIANDSPYGLSGMVYGGRERAHAVARRIRTGTIGVNGGVWYAADVPFGGYKQSGTGREMGAAGFEEYLETKVIAEAVT